MQSKLSVGIVLPSNNLGGACKLTAMMANDLASIGHRVTIFMPVLPFYYYHVTVAHRPLSWLKHMVPYATEWVRHHRFAFHEMLNHEQPGGRISVRSVLTYAPKWRLKKFDWLVVNGISDVIMYQNRFPQDRQVYIVNQLEEHAHRRDEFKKVRQSFKGRIVAISPFTARMLGEHIETPPVVPNPISPGIWEQRHNFDYKAKRRDLLLYWKNNDAGGLGGEIIKYLLQMRPETTVTVWFRSALDTNRTGVQRVVPGVQYAENLDETEVADLLLDHSMLLFPNRFEEFGMPPVEALACGCIPVLHPDVGAAEMYAHDGENSLYLSEVPEEDARRIMHVLDNPETLGAMRMAAPDSVEAFAPSRYGLRVLEAAGVL